ncbi:MAG: Ig-like domain-containing protein [Fimbriimonadales bacterium]|nr:Ig-like domain-containing protein [Fimbriimonadales bacterium]MDW8051634.1 Ig-like domain-containing protein [Armatimonadota bacterium]
MPTLKAFTYAKLLAGGLMFLCLCVSWADGVIRLTAYPAAAVADGASQVLIVAEVRTARGKPAPDGTKVAFSATSGTFREAVVATEGGVARATLIASQLPSVATVTATVIGLGVVGETQVLFVATQDELRTATEYVQVLGREYLAYANEQRVIAASGKERGARVRFGFTEITADDLQLEVDTLRVKARNARLRFGSAQIECIELSYELRTAQGYALVQYPERWALVRLRNATPEPHEAPVSPELFRFVDISESELVIKAAQIWFYPNERIQFHRAEFYVGAVRTLSLPLYSQALWGAGVGTDSLIGIQNGQVYLDVPYYYALTPRQIGALRLRTAQVSGRTVGVARGLFVDLEHEYRLGTGTGTVSVLGLARTDWGLRWQHQHSLSPDTRLALWLDSPAHQGLYGSAQLTSRGHGYSIGLTVAGSTLWHGGRTRSWRTDAFLETNPHRLGQLPLRQSVALSAAVSHTQLAAGTLRRAGIGIRARWSLVPQSLGRTTTLTGSLSVGRYVGNLPNAGWSIMGTLGITHALGAQGALNLTYDYAQDALGTSLLGQHRLSSSLSWSLGERYALSSYFSRALDTKSISFGGDFSWRLSHLWRISTGYTWQAYQGYEFRDQTFTLAYRIGYRELALTWSSASRRWSLDLLMAVY